MTRAAWALALLAVSACQEPGRLNVLLRVSDEIDLMALPQIEIRLLDQATESELDRATASGAELADLPRLFAHADLEPRVEYAIEVRAPTDDCAAGRAVGRSVPVTIGSDRSRDTVTVFVACADAVTATGRMNDERAGHAAIWAPAQGGAVFAGGASSLVTGPPASVESIATVEIYDVATGQFTLAAPLRQARFEPGIALDPDGRVLVMGGAPGDFGPDVLLDSVEELDGEARGQRDDLDGRWLEPRTMALGDGNLAILGLGLDSRPYQVSFYDPRREGGAPHHEPLGRDLPGTIVVPFPGRGRALIAGGGVGGDPVRPVLFCEGGQCGCGSEPCLLPLAAEDDPERWGPGPGWAEAAGAWLPCPEGGGTAYVMGGRTRAREDGPDDPVGDVYCHRDTDEVDTGFVKIGTVTPRISGGVVAVRGGRLLVVGGYGATPLGNRNIPVGLAEAELLDVPACGCQALHDEDVTEVLVDAALGEEWQVMLGRSAVVLGDGAVLISGRAELDALELNIEARSEAWVFMPDLGP